MGDHRPPPDLVLEGRVIKQGTAEGHALVSPEPIGFLGGVDGKTGIVTERGHPLEGVSVAGRVLVFPTGKGSTVGSYVLYELAANGLAPAAILNTESESPWWIRSQWRRSGPATWCASRDPGSRSGELTPTWIRPLWVGSGLGISGPR